MSQGSREKFARTFRKGSCKRVCFLGGFLDVGVLVSRCSRRCSGESALRTAWESNP